MTSLPWLLLPPPPPDESPETAHELEPHRLIQELCRAGDDSVTRDTVDRILARGPDCAPLLLDVLRAFAAGVIEEGAGLAARSLALLGEIGGPSVLPEICLFFAGEEDEDAISDAADWAFQRIGAREPAATLRMMAELAETAEPLELSDLVKQLSTMPDVPGRTEMLFSFAKRLPDFDDASRGLVVTNMVIAAMAIDGPNGKLVASIRQEYGSHLHREYKEILQAVEKELIRTPPDEPHGEGPSVYDLVCDGFQMLQQDEPYVREEPKLGRNDPCWCGSGKKYKKCHLAADEERP